MPDRFKAELSRIASLQTGELEIVDEPNPASRGWLRRPDYDVAGTEAWEHPDGRLLGIRRARRRTSRKPEP